MCIVMQMTLMNIGLAKWDAMVVIPVFQVSTFAASDTCIFGPSFVFWFAVKRAAAVCVCACVFLDQCKSTWTMVSILSGAIVYNEFEAFNNCPPAGDAICTAGGFGTHRQHGFLLFCVPCLLLIG